jgi:hypothetical protein
MHLKLIQRQYRGKIDILLDPMLQVQGGMLHTSTAPLPMRYTTMGYTSTRYTSTALYFYKQFTQDSFGSEPLVINVLWRISVEIVSSYCVVNMDPALIVHNMSG